MSYFTQKTTGVAQAQNTETRASIKANVKFTIETLNDSGSGMKYTDKEAFLKEVSLMIDDCIANGGTYFDIAVDSDASCFSSEEVK